MKIVFIGAGNLATHLALRLQQCGHSIIQIYSRTAESAKQLANQVNAPYTTDIKAVTDRADFYIFSVKDSVLEELISQIPHTKGIWLHTAGSMPANIFDTRIADYGVLYPLQTFSKNKEIQWAEIPLFIEGSNHITLNKIEDLAKDLSEKIYNLPSEKRIYIHASAVFACNFVNHMYEQAKHLTDKANIPFEVLLPLIKETCGKVYHLDPHEAQTGPAVRFDTNVMKKHLALLKEQDALDIYQLISKSIYNSFLK